MRDPRYREPSYEEDFYEGETRTVKDIVDAAGLTQKQRFVLNLRYGRRDGKRYTQREIAAFMGIRQQSVHDIEKAAKRKLEGVLFE